MTRQNLDQTRPRATRAMEPETIQKNGASPKNHTSRGNSMMSWFIASLFFPVLFSSCDNKKDEGPAFSPATISAKWEITDPNSQYASFEFNKDGTYIVIEKEYYEQALALARGSAGRGTVRTPLFGNFAGNAATRSSSESNLSPIHTGTYTIEGEKIILSGFGVLDVISITAEEFTFSFTLESASETEEYVANKAAEPISSSSRTDMFCRTWVIEKITIDESALSESDKEDYIQEYGPEWKKEVEEIETAEIAGGIALFSRAGTYLIMYENEENSEAGLSEWKWANEEETTIYYSWDNWEDNWEENIVKINDLKSNSLILQERELIFHLTR
ncbi:MAG: hypothetical protein LBP56_07830 [Odoribacteraceae bacterium]|jgi:hypothetical protein|nr:hypothetical protein [Odoribacteraceae bacterium]